MNTAFVYSDEFVRFDYGPDHPLKIFRLKLTYDLMDAYGLFSLGSAKVFEPSPATEEDLLLFHDAGYIEMLKAVNCGTSVPGAESFGLGPGDNPIFRGFFDWSRLVTGASVKAAEMVESGEADIAFNIAGGLHHALSARASGFCYINDPVIAIMSLLKRGRKVAYIDIDAHHGDGVQKAFYSTDRVLTISFHETGDTLFPGTGFAYEIGEGPGRGFSLNVPLPPHSDDELFLYAFREIVPETIERFRPDVVVSQLGVDSFRTDPLTHLNYTTNGFCEAVRLIKGLSNKWVALGGGGYDVENVAKAWTLAWAIMNGLDIADNIPADYLKRYEDEEFRTPRLRDEAYVVRGGEKGRMREDVDKAIQYLRKNALAG